jgi:glucose-1-phosphate thymidylyltransferase
VRVFCELAVTCCNELATIFFQSILGYTMKGIVLSGGIGSRLYPLTKVASKQLLPVYDKPLVYYPIATLMLANIREILLIAAPNQIAGFQALLSDGREFGLNISYKIQESPAGIAESLILAEQFLAGSKSALILGDNLFHGSGLGRRLEGFREIDGAQIFGYHVQDPSPYGVAVVNEENLIKDLVEKPKNSESKVAIPGLYFFDETASERAKKLSPSERGELEIIDLLKSYLVTGDLNLEMLPRGTAWFDSGSFDDLHEAGVYVKLMQERTGERVGDPFEIAKLRGWVI